MYGQGDENRCEETLIVYFDEFTIEEQVEIFEIAQLGLAMVFTEISEELDLNDEYLVKLRDKMEDAAGKGINL